MILGIYIWDHMALQRRLKNPTSMLRLVTQPHKLEVNGNIGSTSAWEAATAASALFQNLQDVSPCRVMGKYFFTGQGARFFKKHLLNAMDEARSLEPVLTFSVMGGPQSPNPPSPGSLAVHEDLEQHLHADWDHGG